MRRTRFSNRNSTMSGSNDHPTMWGTQGSSCDSTMRRTTCSIYNKIMRITVANYNPTIDGNLPRGARREQEVLITIQFEQ